MSVSQKVKEELYPIIPKSRHCEIAELAALVSFLGEYDPINQGRLLLDTDNERILKKFFTLLKKTTNITYCDKFMLSEDTVTLLNLLKYDLYGNDLTNVDGLILQQPCCKRAFIRGAFIADGSVSDPEKGYHFEIACKTMPQAILLQEAINFFDVSAKIIERKGRFVVYLKEGAQIVDILNVMEAHVSLMEFENVRIIKEMRNTVNRRVNCEAANISKTVNAAVRQVEDIRLIEKEKGLKFLPDSLREIAVVRLENPDVPLKDLGDMLSPPIGKSGVNHRLRKISEIADKLRN